MLHTLIFVIQLIFKSALLELKNLWLQLSIKYVF